MIWNTNYKKELICECGNGEFYAIYSERGHVIVNGKGEVLEEHEMEESYVESHRKCTECEKTYENI